MFGGLAVFLFWGLLILVVVLAVRAAARSSADAGARTGAEAPLDILRRRYAAGEISREQFDQMRRDLQ